MRNRPLSFRAIMSLVLGGYLLVMVTGGYVIHEYDATGTRIAPILTTVRQHHAAFAKAETFPNALPVPKE